VTTRRIGGANRASTSELVHIDPPKIWGVRGIDGPIRAAVEVLVEPVTGSRSRLTISVDFTGHGIGKILVPLMVRPEARKEMPGNLAALKQRMEAAKPPRRAGSTRKAARCPDQGSSSMTASDSLLARAARRIRRWPSNARGCGRYSFHERFHGGRAWRGGFRHRP
jgi:hypothetical protein